MIFLGACFLFDLCVAGYFTPRVGTGRHVEKKFGGLGYRRFPQEKMGLNQDQSDEQEKTQKKVTKRKFPSTIAATRVIKPVRIKKKKIAYYARLKQDWARLRADRKRYYRDLKKYIKRKRARISRSAHITRQTKTKDS